MTPGGAVRIGLAALLAVGAFMLALSALTALGGGASTLPHSERLEMAAGHNRRAVSLVLKQDRTQADLKAAAAASARALRLYPYDLGAILRLAQIETLQTGHLTEAAQARLRTSYDLVAIDPSLASWRVPFCLAWWAQLPPDLRAAAELEFMTVARDKAQRRRMRVALADMSQEPGALVAALWISRLPQ